jgi:LacI family transcriptional regulator
MSRRPSSKPTLTDVAARAGVSVATASQALRGKGRISRDVRRSVAAAAQSIGYEQPRRTTGITAVLTMMGYEWAYTWGMNQRIIDSFSTTLRTAGREPVLVPVREDEGSSELVARLRKLRADSVVAVHYGNADALGRLEAQGLPVVVIMNGNLQHQFTSVCVDDYRGGYDAGRVLLDAGHRVVAYVSSDLPVVSAVRTDRLVGLRRALEEASLSLHLDHQPIVPIHDHVRTGQEVRRLTVTAASPGTPTPTAIFVMDDYLGARVLQALNNAGVNVPREISLLCAGDVLDYGESFVPALSTMSIQFESMGRAAAEMLLAAPPDGWRSAEHEVLKVRMHYVDRGTVARVSR